MPAPPPPNTLLKAALACGLVGFVVALLPLAVYREPPIWWGWIDPAAVDHAPRETGFRFQIGRLLVDAHKTEDPEIIAAREARKKRRQNIFLCRATATILGLAGLTLVLGTWRGQPDPNLFHAAGIIATLAAAWEFIVLAIAAATFLIAASALGAAWA